MASESPLDGLDDGPVARATRAELKRLTASPGEPSPIESVDGARAMNLAGILDDRDGIQAGGVASTDKQLGALMESIREKYKPKGVGRLELLRGGAGAAG